MNCKTFIERFSDYRDGVASDSVTRAADEHLERCAACREYQRVVERGLAVLKGGSEVDVPEDFHSRLQHRLFHAEEEEALMAQAGSSASAMAVLGIALVLTAVAWSPMLRPAAPDVELAPILVSRPPVPVMGFRPANAFPYPQQATRATLRATELFDDPQAIFFEHSALSQRYRTGTQAARSASLEASN